MKHFLKKLQNIDPLQYINEQTTGECWLVGGSVRDLLRNKTVKDIDIVISGLPLDTVITIFSRFGEVDIVGKNFGVIKWKSSNKTLYEKYGIIDIALPRTEVATTNSGQRKDFIVTADHTLPITADVARRDFTINAMAVGIFSEQLIDEWDGKKHLRKKILTTPGEPKQRLQEDISRILRGIRFSTQLNVAITPKVLRAIKQLASQTAKPNLLSKELLITELSRALYYNAPQTFTLLKQTNVLTYLFPKLYAKRNTRLQGKSHYQRLEKTLHYLHTAWKNKLSDNDYITTVMLVWAIANLNSQPNRINGQKITDFIADLRFTSANTFTISPQTIDHVAHSIETIIKQKNDFRLTETETMAFQKDSNLVQPMCMALAYFWPQLKTTFGYNSFMKNHKKLQRLAPLPTPLIDGHDITKQFPKLSGKKIGQALTMVREMQLAKKITTKQQALTYLAEL